MTRTKSGGKVGRKKRVEERRGEDEVVVNKEGDESGHTARQHTHTHDNTHTTLFFPPEQSKRGQWAKQGGRMKTEGWEGRVGEK